MKVAELKIVVGEIDVVVTGLDGLEQLVLWKRVCQQPLQSQFYRQMRWTLLHVAALGTLWPIGFPGLSWYCRTGA